MISTALLALALAFSVQTAPTDPEMVRFEQLRPTTSPQALAPIDQPADVDPSATAERLPAPEPEVAVGPPPVPTAPDPILPPPCEGTDQQVLVVQNWDDPLRCNPDGSQILVYVVPHGEHADPAVCEYMGALWMWDQQTLTAYCVGVDY